MGHPGRSSSLNAHVDHCPSSIALSESIPAQQVLLRPLAIRDLSGVQDLFLALTACQNDAFSALQENPVRVSYEMRRLRQNLLAEQRYLCFVAEHEGRLAGYAAGVVEVQAPIFKVDTYCSINEVFVQASYRRRGLGRALVTEVLAAAQAMGIGWANVHLVGDARAAEPFFASLGFHVGALELRSAL